MSLSLSDFLLNCHPRNNDRDLLLIMKAWPLPQTSSQLALITQTYLFLLICVPPHSFLPLFHYVCLTLSMSCWQDNHIQIIFFLSFPGSPTYSLLPSYRPIGATQLYTVYKYPASGRDSTLGSTNDPGMDTKFILPVCHWPTLTCYPC